MHLTLFNYLQCPRKMWLPPISSLYWFFFSVGAGHEIATDKDPEHTIIAGCGIQNNAAISCWSQRGAGRWCNACTSHHDQYVNHAGRLTKHKQCTGNAAVQLFWSQRCCWTNGEIWLPCVRKHIIGAKELTWRQDRQSSWTRAW